MGIYGSFNVYPRSLLVLCGKGEISNDVSIKCKILHMPFFHLCSCKLVNNFCSAY